MLRPLPLFLLLSAAVASTVTAPYAIAPKVLQQIQVRYGEQAKARFLALEHLVNEAAALPEKEKLRRVNDFFNKVRWMNDLQVWGQEDYWATPLEFLGRNQGDCEDFVIAKYTTLKRLGVADEKLYLTYVEALNYRQKHMVLSYYETPRSVPLILDNINFKVLPGTQRTDLRPIYSFNGESLFLAKEQGLGKRIPGSSGANQKWENFLSKLEKEIL